MAQYIIIVFVCFGASALGSVCGIGGGVIIKPVLDAVGILPVNMVSFLSGCTVLSMSLVSVGKNLLSGRGEKFDKKRGTLLALGAAAGGILGERVYQVVLGLLPDTQTVGAVQAAALLAVTAGTLWYTLKKEGIRSKHLEGLLSCAVMGTALGMMSVFLGIGGGPINLVVLYYFFSMGTKEAAGYSLYIIMFSQLAGLLEKAVGRQIPQVSVKILVLMILCGVAGGLAGSQINRKIEEYFVDHLFIGVMVVIIVINIYNVFKYI